jgi:hypothetical protein
LRGSSRRGRGSYRFQAARRWSISTNLPAVDITLTPDDLGEIDAVFATIESAGAPLSPALEAAIDK